MVLAVHPLLFLHQWIPMESREYFFQVTLRVLVL